MSKVVIFGNSGSGKSTLAKQLQQHNGLSHCDLDTLAWLESSPPQRMPIEESAKLISGFIKSHQSWVIEGCYADLLALVIPHAEQLIFLNLSVEQCISNAKQRPWEPHKYQSKEAQDANLDFLIDWIRQYEQRQDAFSKQAHQELYDCFKGEKAVLMSLDFECSFFE